MRALAATTLMLAGCLAGDLPAALTDFEPRGVTIFEGDPASWDPFLLERGWIVHEDDRWTYWYTAGDFQGRFRLGRATSPDGLAWTRAPAAPIWEEGPIQDCQVVRDGDLYRMIAESPGGTGEMPQTLDSPDGVTWTGRGQIDLRTADGAPIKRGEYGTPTVLHEADVWWLFYENDDAAVWLARSTDFHTFVNVQDDPVLTLGPSTSDDLQMALNQVLPYQGRYYAYYSGLGHRPEWTVNLAVSDDLIHWRKWAGNPVLPAADNETSGYVVSDGRGLRLYTVNTQVRVHFAR